VLGATKGWLTRPSGVVVPVSYVGLGAGFATLGSGFSFSGPTAAVGDYIVLDVDIDRAATITSCTYDGSAMTLLATAPHNNSEASNGSLRRYGIVAAGAGAKTIALACGSSWISANATAFRGVGSIGTHTTVFGTGTSRSQAITCPTASHMVVQTFGQGAGGSGGAGNLTSITNATNRYNSNSGTVCGACINTATAAATVSATNGSSMPWSGIASVLAPV
jgi:hypothetical protein